MKKKSVRKKHRFLTGLFENFAKTEEFRKQKGAFARFCDRFSIFLIYTFKYVVNSFQNSPFKRYLPFVCLLAGWSVIIGISAFILTNYSFGVKVRMGASEFIVKNKAEFLSALETIENEYTAKIGSNFYFDSQPVYSLSFTEKNLLSDKDDINAILSEEAEISMGKSFGVFVDGELVGTYPYESELQELFERIKALYSDPDAIKETITVLNKVEFKRGLYSKSKAATIDELFLKLTAPADNRTVTVKKGDKLADIAAKYDLTQTQLKLLNPDYNFNSLKAGTKLYVSAPEYPLDVRVEKTVVYTKQVKYKTITTNDRTMFENQSVVNVKGSNGTTEYTDIVTLVNGEEQSRITEKTIVLKKVVNREVTKGTKTIAPTGSFISPITKGKYKITSLFLDEEYRQVFGTDHYGVDYGASSGTPIFAIDAGTVIYAGWSTNGFGYLVKVEHQKGVISYYAHCKKLLVKKGDKVYQGQTIAQVGSTGNSTGNHLHLELWVNKERVNPLKYIK